MNLCSAFSITQGELPLLYVLVIGKAGVIPGLICPDSPEAAPGGHQISCLAIKPYGDTNQRRSLASLKSPFLGASILLSCPNLSLPEFLLDVSFR